MGRGAARNPAGLKVRVGERGLTPRLAMASGIRLLRCSGLPQRRDLAVTSPQERRLRTRPLHHADSRKIHYRIGAVPPELQADKCFVTAHQTHAPPAPRRAIWPPRVAMTARILLESGPPAWSPSHGGSGALCWIRVRDQFLAILGASRTASGCTGNAWEISAAAVALSSTPSLGLERSQRVRISRTSTAVVRVDEVPVRYA